MTGRTKNRSSCLAVRCSFAFLIQDGSAGLSAPELAMPQPRSRARFEDFVECSGPKNTPQMRTDVGELEDPPLDAVAL